MLAGVVMVVLLHVTLGDPEQFWAPFVRDLAEEMQRRGLPMDLEQDGLVETLARTLWGWVTVLTMLLAMCALFLARWWQTRLRPRMRDGSVPSSSSCDSAWCWVRRGALLDRRVAADGPAAGGRPGADSSGRADGGRTRGGASLQGGGPAERRCGCGRYTSCWCSRRR